MSPENGSWAAREPDEPVTDWLLRLQISYAVIENRSRAAELERTA